MTGIAVPHGNVTGISEGLTPAKLAEMLDTHGESFDPCAERETFDYSMMINVESELKSQLEFVPDRILNTIGGGLQAADSRTAKSLTTAYTC